MAEGFSDSDEQNRAPDAVRPGTEDDLGHFQPARKGPVDRYCRSDAMDTLPHNSQLRSAALVDSVRLNVPPTHYRSYGDGFLRVK